MRGASEREEASLSPFAGGCRPRGSTGADKYSTADVESLEELDSAGNRNE